MALRLDIAPDTPNQSGYDLSKYDLVFEFSVVVRRGGSRGWLVIRCKTEKPGGIVLLADNGRTAYSAQAGSRYRYEGTPFAWGPIQGQIRRLGLQCQLPCVFKRGPTDECLIPMPPPYLVGDATGRNLNHVVVASVVSDTSKPLPLPDNARLFRGGPSLGKAESDSYTDSKAKLQDIDLLYLYVEKTF